MTEIPDWWAKPRHVSVLVDNPSWVLPFAEELVERLRTSGDDAVLCRIHDEIASGAVGFFLGCVNIAPTGVLARNRRNLVVHAGDLPRDRGFSPWTWAILRGDNRIAICLLEAAEQVDSGNVIFRDWIDFGGHELVDELRAKIGRSHVELCLRFMHEAVPPPGLPQDGEPTYLKRRKPDDSRIDPNLPLAKQFDLLRVVDNERYPAFFEFRGNRYVFTIRKSKSSQ